jgi:hypothetical protein
VEEFTRPNRGKTSSRGSLAGYEGETALGINAPSRFDFVGRYPQLPFAAGQDPKSLPATGAFLLVPVFRDPDFGNVLTPNFRALL